MMLGATFLHWDRFPYGSTPFVLWLWVYLITPILVPAVWLVNRRHDPGTPEARDAVFPAWARRLMVAAGVGMLAISAWIYSVPESAIARWPCMRTPRTPRRTAAFGA